MGRRRWGRTVCAGLIAGAAGTAAMDLAYYATAYLGGSDRPLLEWEFGGPSRWDAISGPGQAGRKFYEAVLHTPLPERYARLTNNVVHWGYGIANGVTLAVAAELARSGRRAWVGPLFGSALWASSYVTLPLAGVYQPIWTYPPSVLAPEYAGHLVYGTAAHSVWRALRSRA